MWHFEPIYKPTIWGGRKIAEMKGIDMSSEKIGESWEISSITGSVSIVKSAIDTGLSLQNLIEKYGAQLVGSSNYRRFGTKFPLLVKFIDASHDLSIQVHPDSRLAVEEGLENGKTEMWYIMDTTENAQIANGFIKPVNDKEYEILVNTGEIEKWVRYIPTSPGMTFLIPPGRIHAIGKGNFLCEIQESCDATYRIYDYKRKDTNGKQRELHTDKALKALNFNDCDGDSLTPINFSDQERRLIERPEFTVNLFRTGEQLSRNYSNIDSFVLLIGTKGKASLKVATEDTPGIKETTLHKGELVLIAASTKGLTITPTEDSEFLEAYIQPDK